MTERPGATPAQDWDPQHYARSAGFVAELGAPLIDWLQPKAGEHILDLGCGEGALTAKLAASLARVTGIDSSPAQVAAARARGLDAHVGDAARLGIEGRFDAVFSNAALHWVRDQDAAFAGVALALKPRGRFVAEMGGEGNVARVVRALTTALGRRGIDAASRNPWVFPTQEACRARLVANGFVVERLEHFARPTLLHESLADWLEVFARVFLEGLPSGERENVKAEIEAMLAPTQRDARGQWTVDYVRLRFAARLR